LEILPRRERPPDLSRGLFTTRTRRCHFFQVPGKRVSRGLSLSACFLKKRTGKNYRKKVIPTNFIVRIRDDTQSTNHVLHHRIFGERATLHEPAWNAGVEKCGFNA